MSSASDRILGSSLQGISSITHEGQSGNSLDPFMTNHKTPFDISNINPYHRSHKRGSSADLDLGFINPNNVEDTFSHKRQSSSELDFSLIFSFSPEKKIFGNFPVTDENNSLAKMRIRHIRKSSKDRNSSQEYPLRVFPPIFSSFVRLNPYQSNHLSDQEKILGPFELPKSVDLTPDRNEHINLNKDAQENLLKVVLSYIQHHYRWKELPKGGIHNQIDAKQWKSRIFHLDEENVLKLYCLDLIKFDTRRGDILFKSENLSPFFVQIHHVLGVQGRNIIDESELQKGDLVVGAIMERMHGGDLCQEIESPAYQPSMDKTRKWGMQLIEAMEELHNLGICHRDIKCDNIFLSLDKENLKIGDYDLSIQMKINANRSDFQTADTPCGTKHYLPPEIALSILGINRKGYTLAADIYSLGVVLQSMVTKQLPEIRLPIDFAVENDEESQTLLQDVDERKDLKFFLDFPEGSDWRFTDLIQKMLSPNPNDRFTLEQIKKHPFFAEPNESKILTSPLKKLFHYFHQ